MPHMYLPEHNYWSYFLDIPVGLFDVGSAFCNADLTLARVVNVRLPPHIPPVRKVFDSCDHVDTTPAGDLVCLRSLKANPPQGFAPVHRPLAKKDDNACYDVRSRALT